MNKAKHKQLNMCLWTWSGYANQPTEFRHRVLQHNGFGLHLLK